MTAARAHWQAAYGAKVICPPYRSATRNWPKPLRRWLSSLRQIIESVNTKLLNTFRLEHERPHALDGFYARLAAKAALHNSCCWLNRQRGRGTSAGWLASRLGLAGDRFVAEQDWVGQGASHHRGTLDTPCSPDASPDSHPQAALGVAQLTGLLTGCHEHLLGDG